MRARNPYALVLSGGPASVYSDDAPRVDPALFELGVPILGICYGAQLMALELGGRVDRTGVSEFGRTSMEATESRLLADTPPEQTVWMSHRDTVVAAPEGARIVASSPATPVAAFEAPERGLYGVQFHPEVVHTPHGMDVLKNFLYRVADAPREKVVEADYAVPYLAHATMEPMNATAQLKDGALDIWCGNQAPTLVRQLCANQLGIEQDKVTVHTTFLGGGFGRRVEMDYALYAALMATL